MAQSGREGGLVRRHAVASYFVLTFAISWLGALVVVAKATEGTGYTNPEYGSFRAEAERSGAFFCAYHFLAAGNAAGQAAHCHAVAGNTPVMLDFEPTPTSRPTVADAQGFIDAYRKTGGTCWLLYYPQWYWQQHGSPRLRGMQRRGMLLVSSRYGGYTDSPTVAGWQSYGGLTPTVWQYSSTTP